MNSGPGRGNLTLLIMGLIVFVIGTILLGIEIDTAETTGAKTNIGSFTGVRSVNDLFPLIFAAAVILIGLGMMLGGGRGAYRNLRGE